MWIIASQYVILICCFKMPLNIYKDVFLCVCNIIIILNTNFKSLMSSNTQSIFKIPPKYPKMSLYHWFVLVRI